MDGRYEGEVRVGSEWRLRCRCRDSRDYVIRLVGPEDFMEGGWLYEFVRVAGKPVDGRKKKRISDDVLRSAYEPIEEEKMDEARGRPRKTSSEELLSTADPRVWAEAFVDAFPGAIAEHGVDEETLTGWFANAMQAKGTAIEKAAREDSEDEPEPKIDSPFEELFDAAALTVAYPRPFLENEEHQQQGLSAALAEARRAVRAQLHRFSTEELHTLVFEVGGAATAPCLAAAPTLVMPTEEVTDGINAVLAEKGLPIAERHGALREGSE